MDTNRPEPVFPRPLLVAVLLAFGALSAVAMGRHGYWGIFQPLVSSWAGAQVLADLAIALLLWLVWMWGDARAHGRNPWPWVVLTLTAGSFGPLLYLLLRRPR
jgi:hypothetical protein